MKADEAMQKYVDLVEEIARATNLSQNLLRSTFRDSAVLGSLMYTKVHSGPALRRNTNYLCSRRF